VEEGDLPVEAHAEAEDDLIVAAVEIADFAAEADEAR
jgi:hypothetical protein